MPHQIHYRRQLLDLAYGSARLMAMLRTVRELDLPSWCVGAGTVRNLVWDALHGFAEPSPLGDVDVAYFDSRLLPAETDVALQAHLTGMVPHVRWEVTNQATVHEWYAAYFGHPIAPHRSLEAAMASWPEYATAVGLRLEGDDTLTVIAPHGLDDLFAMRVRRNLLVSADVYRKRLAEKCFDARWPKVRIMHDEG